MAILDRNSMSGPPNEKDSNIEVLGRPISAIFANGDERQYGSSAAEMLRKAARDVALSSSIEAKLEAFHKGASTLSKAAVDQWLPKSVVVDHLVQIASAQNDFGLAYDDIEGII